MSWEAILEVGGLIVFLGVAAYIVIAPVKVGKPYMEGTEWFDSERKDGDGGRS